MALYSVSSQDQYTKSKKKIAQIASVIWMMLYSFLLSLLYLITCLKLDKHSIRISSLGYQLSKYNVLGTKQDLTWSLFQHLYSLFPLLTQSFVPGFVKVLLRQVMPVNISREGNFINFGHKRFLFLVIQT